MARTAASWSFRRQRRWVTLGAALLALGGLLIPATADASASPAVDPAYPSVGPGTHFLDDDALLAGFKEPDWYKANIPFLEVPDQQIQQTYYYRWRTWKEHVRGTGPANGDIVSEFFGAPGYSAPFGGIDAAAGHHIDEGRWLRDQSYVDSDINYWLRGAGSGPKPATEEFNPNTTDWAHEYSFWAASSVLADAEVTGDWSQATGLESDLVRQYNGWQHQFNPQLGLYWQVPVWDATEFTASSYETDPADPYHGGAGYRPTLNAYQYGDANAIATIAALAGDPRTAATFRQQAAALEANMQKYLWDPSRDFFYHMARDNNPGDALVSTREEMGFTPWMFDMPQPSDSVAWQQLTDPRGFAAPYGPTTAERRSSWYMYQASQGCCRWDGPSWPYETSQTLTALANLLDDYPAQSYVTPADYDTLLREYALTQYQNGTSYLGQAHDPDQPSWLYGADDYNHSSFNDLVISGLIGLRPQATDTVALKPLVPASWNYFALENVPYHGHNVTILWDRDGSKYHQGAGLHVYVDGAQVARSATLRAMTIPLPAGHTPTRSASTFTNDAVNVYSQGYPRAFASDTWPSDSPWNATDGQVFYDDIPEDTRWTDYGSPNPTDYLGVDFGSAIPVSELRLYTYDDTDHGGGVHTPAAFTAQYWNGTDWVDIPEQTDNPAVPAANALNQITFPSVVTSQVRVVFTKDAGNAVGVTELEAGQATSTAASLSLGAQNAAAITVLPGQQNTVSTTFTNRTNRPLTNVQVKIPLPAGWSAQATTRTSAPVVAPGATFRTTWQITPSTTTGPGTQTALFADATFGPPGGPGTVQTRTTVNVAYNPSFYPNAQIDDQFTSNTLSNYQVLQPFPNESVPQLTAGAGQLSATSATPFFGLLQSSASPATAESTVSVDAAQFTNDPSESEDTLFVGLAKDNVDYVMAWYNNHAKSSGFDVRVNGQLNVGVDTHCCAGVTIVPGDRFAVAYSGTEVTSFLEHNGSWQQLTSFDVGGAINLADPAVRAQYTYALGLRGSHGTVAISRFTGASSSP